MLHTLVSEARDGMSAAAVAVACERDPEAPHDMDEIVAALQLLLEDGLAEREADSPGQPGGAHKPRSSPKPGATDEREPDTTYEPHGPPRRLYRPTRAAIRANELSF